MATNPDGAVEEAHPDDPRDLLPDNSVLRFEEYLEMHTAIGHPTRYEIVYRLVNHGDMSPKELENAIGVDDSTLHYHLNNLLDAGLIEKRKQTERGQEGLYTYYRATIFGEVTLTKGVNELMRSERAFDDMYNSSSVSG